MTVSDAVPIVGCGARAAALEGVDDLRHRANESATRPSVPIPTCEDASLLRRSLPTFLATEPGTVPIVVLDYDPAPDVAVAAASTSNSRYSRSTGRRWSPRR